MRGGWTVSRLPTSDIGMDTSNAVNWTLLKDLQGKPHRYFNPTVDLPAGTDVGVSEAVMHSGVAHHVLDLTRIPAQDGYGQDLDARVFQAVSALLDARLTLSRLAGVHAREKGDGGTVGDFCTECGWRWPCLTYRVATGQENEDDS